jgi:LysM repeat protein
MRGQSTLARYAAPAAFLLAATVAILLIRSALSTEDGTAPPPAATTATTTNAPQGPPPTTTGQATTTTPSAQFYVIQEGDTLADVAEEFDTTVEQLLVLNPDVDPVSLTIGQRIRVR